MIEYRGEKVIEDMLLGMKFPLILLINFMLVREDFVVIFNFPLLPGNGTNVNDMAFNFG